MTFLCTSKQIIDSTLKCIMIYTNLVSFIVLELHYMLGLSKNWLHFETYKFLIFQNRTVKFLALNMNIIFLKFLKG